MKNVLAQLRLGEKLVGNRDEGEALANVCKMITKLSPQVPTFHRVDAHKSELLKNAVVGCKWATEPLNRISTHNVSFQKLYGELEAADKLHKEAKTSVLRDYIGTSKTNVDDEESRIAGLLYAG